jgi:ribose/xylose/arabinose/galactoside ABC-type transport system permease subunit
MDRALAVDGSVGSARFLGARRLVNERGVLAGLVVVALAFGVVIGPQFFAAANLELMARQTVIVCVAALGMTMIIVSGGIDLSVGSIVALSTVVVAVLLRHGAGPFAAALGAVAAGAACGAINGLLVTQLRVVPFIVTLGTMLLVRGAAKGLADERRVEAPITWLNDLLRTARDGRGWLLPSGIWMTAALAVAVAFTLQYTRFGRHLFAIGSSERTARLCGVRIDRTKLAVYTAGAALAALSGVLQFSKLSVGDPTVAQSLELDVIAAVIIGGGSLLGGRGSVVGTIAGAAIMAVIQIGCSQQGLPNWVQQIVTGAIIVFAVGLDRWRQKAA